MTTTTLTPTVTDTLAARSELLDWIFNLDDEVVLGQLLKIKIDNPHTTEEIVLTEAQKADLIRRAIESEEDIKAGRLLTREELLDFLED